MLQIEVRAVAGYVSPEHLHGRRSLEVLPQCLIHVGLSRGFIWQLLHDEFGWNPRVLCSCDDPRPRDGRLEPSHNWLHFHVQAGFGYRPTPGDECRDLRGHEPMVRTSRTATGKIESCWSTAIG